MPGAAGPRPAAATRRCDDPGAAGPARVPPRGAACPHRRARRRAHRPRGGVGRADEGLRAGQARTAGDPAPPRPLGRGQVHPGAEVHRGAGAQGVVRRPERPLLPAGVGALQGPGQPGGRPVQPPAGAAPRGRRRAAAAQPGRAGPALPGAPPGGGGHGCDRSHAPAAGRAPGAAPARLRRAARAAGAAGRTDAADALPRRRPVGRRGQRAAAGAAAAAPGSAAAAARGLLPQRGAGLEPLRQAAARVEHQSRADALDGAGGGRAQRRGGAGARPHPLFALGGGRAVARRGRGEQGQPLFDLHPGGLRTLRRRRGPRLALPGLAGAGAERAAGGPACPGGAGAGADLPRRSAAERAGPEPRLRGRGPGPGAAAAATYGQLDPLRGLGAAGPVRALP